MKDVVGKVLNVGDTVVTMFDDYSTLTICKVHTISKKKVGVVIVDADTTAPVTRYITRTMPVRYKFPSQVAKVTLDG